MSFEIYLDVDDLLNSFTLPVLRRLSKRKIGPYDYDVYPKAAGYDFCEALRIIMEWEFADFPYNMSNVWNDHPELVDLFRDAPKSLECDRLIQWACDQVGPENVYLATKPVPTPKCYYYKALWIQENIPSSLHSNVIIHPNKWMMGRDDRLLIDDSWENCRKWCGPRICFGRPWNDSTHNLETVLRDFSVVGSASDVS